MVNLPFLIVKLVFSFASFCVLCLPSRIRVCSPGATDTIELVINQKIMKVELMLQAVGHGNAGRACADDDGIKVLCVGRHCVIKNVEWPR